MPKNDLNVTLKGIDELLFSTEEQRQEEKREQVQQIPIDELHPFTNHPFKVVDDEAMTRTVESIAQFGVLAPLIARPRPDGDGYEIISGHRRQYAAKLAGLETLPVIVRDMDDDRQGCGGTGTGQHRCVPRPACKTDRAAGGKADFRPSTRDGRKVCYKR